MTEILATADSARCDRYAIENGIGSQTLMSNAGHAVASAIRARWAPRPVLVLAGPGNNGGDGLIAATALRAAGWPVRVVLFTEPQDLAGDAAWALGVWDAPVLAPEPVAWGDAALVVDAVFGAGLSRSVGGLPARWLDALSTRSCPVVAIDLPSGIRGDARPLSGIASKADLTVTFHRRKLAHVIEPHAEMCGEVECADIGVPQGWEAGISPVANLVTRPRWRPLERAEMPATHKHQRGRVAVFSGAASATGAARLSAHAALRAGAGLVTVCSPPAAMLVNAARLTGVMLTRWEGGPDTRRVLDDLRAEAAVLGPAMGVGEATRNAVLAALETGLPLVLDADALTSFEQAPEALLTRLHPACVLTPHLGEFARLFGERDAEANKIERARAAAEACSCTVLLKGPATVVASPGAVPFINRHASPWLATAGSGDVLAGIVATGLAAGMSPHDAAAAAAWLHGDAGRRLGAGLVAEDLPDCLPQVLKALADSQRREAALSHLLTHGS